MMQKTNMPHRYNSHDASGKDNHINYSLRMDERNFRELLADWMLAVGYGPGSDNAGFLKEAGLAGQVSAEDWQALLDGSKAPSKKLAGHLAALLHESGHAEAAHFPGYIIWNHRAGREREKAHGGFDILELSDEQYQALRRPLVEKLYHDIIHHGPVPERNPSPLTQELIEKLHTVEPDLDTAETMSRLARRYRRNPQDVLEFVRPILREASDADLRAWMKEELEPQGEHRGSGQLLRLLRHCAGLTEDELATSIGVERGRINRREMENSPVGLKWFPALKKALRLSDEEYIDLLHIRLPFLEKGWIAKRALSEHGFIEIIQHEMKPKWDAVRKFDVSQYPEEKRPGILLAACRHAAGLSREGLGIKIGITDITAMELGGISIRAEYVPQFIGIFQAASDALPEEDRWFDAGKFRQILGQKRDNALKAARQAIQALDLSQYAPEARPSILLKACRECMGITQDELSRRLEFKSNHLVHWENDTVPQRHVGLLLDVFKSASDALPEAERWFDAKRFHEVCSFKLKQAQAALKVLDLDAYPEDKRAGILLKACRECMGISQNELAHDLGLKNHASIAWWEAGKNTIPHGRADSLVKLFKAASDPLPEGERWFDEAQFKAVLNAQRRGVRTAHFTAAGAVLSPNAQRQARLNLPERSKQEKGIG
jgi:transcriptional regulator with XRE-family HTH domain